MSKVAVFQVCSEGMDGRAPSRIEFASLDEYDRDAFFKDHKNKAYFRKVDVVLSLEVMTMQLLNKLNGNDYLILKEALSFDFFGGDSLTAVKGDTNYELFKGLR